MIIAGNGFPKNSVVGDGVLAAGGSIFIDGAYIGVAADGETIIPNSRRGVNAYKATFDSSIRIDLQNSKVVGGGATASNDYQFSGPAASVSVYGFTAVIANCAIGATSQTVAGGAGGVFFQQSSRNCVMDNTVVGGVSASAAAAVVISAGGTQIRNSCIGVAPVSGGTCQGASGTGAYSSVYNGGIGIHVEISANFASVVGTIVANSGGDGMCVSWSTEPLRFFQCLLGEKKLIDLVKLFVLCACSAGSIMPLLEACCLLECVVAHPLSKDTASNHCALSTLYQQLDHAQPLTLA